jgi:photosystem II stability/assembly factor-like uncharacterized protein
MVQRRITMPNLTSSIALTLMLFAVLALTTVPALAFQDFCVLKVDKEVGAETLWSIGFVYLADLGNTYLVEGDDNAVRRLSAAGAEFSPITTVSRGEDIYIMWPRAAGSDILFSKLLFDLGDGTYLAKMRVDGPRDLESVPYEKAELIPRPFPESAPPAAALFNTPLLVTPKPQVQAIVDAVNGDSLFKTISQMSGNEPVMIGGTLDTLRTRFTPSPKCDAAAEYLRERFESWGLDTQIEEFWFGFLNFDYGDFIDMDTGWIGTVTYVLRTEDGGLSWDVQVPGAAGEDMMGICFLDASTGWVVGTGASIYRTASGGDVWTRQYPPAGVEELYAVAFNDSVCGWAAGDSGNIIRTDDGGATWVSVPSGTSNDIQALYFESEDRGWACGHTGTILFWDGTSWSSQTSGTSQHLYDIQFLNENQGWAVGAGRTILSTTDGGVTWSPHTVPAEASPYLRSVCALSADESWVAGNLGCIIHTTDGGATWEMSDPGTLSDLMFVEFANASEGWIVGHDSYALKTGDGGVSWQGQSENLPGGAVYYAKNVIATLPGTATDEQVIICGHYDSITMTDPMNLAPGADDNASGISAVLAAAELMSPGSYERTVKFICFGAEEQGMRGSLVHAADARLAGTGIAGVVNLDMIAYSDGRPEPADLVCDPASEWLADFCMECGDVYVPTAVTRKVVSSTIVLSDHSSFWYAGYSAIFGHEDIPQVTPYLHTEGDTLGTLAQWFLTKFTKLALATVAELAVPDTTSSGIPAAVMPPSTICAFPNPFSTATTVSFTLGRGCDVSVDVFDVKGRRVRALAHGLLAAGRHELVWDGRDEGGDRVSAGIYFARVSAAGNEATAKTIVLN